MHDRSAKTTAMAPFIVPNDSQIIDLAGENLESPKFWMRRIMTYSPDLSHIFWHSRLQERTCRRVLKYAHSRLDTCASMHIIGAWIYYASISPEICEFSVSFVYEH
jgi:hypothetical protein